MRIYRRAVLGAGLLALAVVAAACGGPGGDGDRAADDGGGTSITVGSDSFPEAQIVGEMYALMLEEADYRVDRQLSIESREVRLPAMESGEIDVAPEYVASLLSVIEPEAEAEGLDDAMSQVQPLLEDMGLTLLEPSEAVDTNAFVVTQDTAQQHGLEKVSDLRGPASDMVLGAPAECPERPFCIPGLKKVYDVEFGDFRALEYGAATVQALKAGAVDVALLFSTDPLIERENLVLLEDDKDLQSADNIVPLVRAEIAEDVSDILNQVSDALTTDKVTQLNARVAVDLEEPRDVARNFLEEEGLL